MAISARLQITPAADRRASPRHKLSLGSSLQTTGEDVTIHDVSPTGMLVETQAELATYDHLEIELPEVGITQGLVVWSSGRFYGCQFRERLSQAAISAAQLRSPPAIPIDLLPAAATAKTDVEVTTEEADAYAADVQEDRAPVSVRLRVILGSAIILWALIIWAIVSVIRLVRA